jgi:DNA-directed RNA polymerase specialized sigma24 family protein
VLAFDRRRAADTADLQLVLRALTAVARGYRLDAADAEDVAQEVIARTLTRTTTGHVTITSPVSYLMTAARRAALDTLQRGSRERLTDPLEEPFGDRYSPADHSLASRFESDATADAIESAMRVARAVEDHVAIRAVSVWLELAEQIDGAPTSRQVAENAQMSHTSVNQALRRFRTYFPQRGPEPSNE